MLSAYAWLLMIGVLGTYPDALTTAVMTAGLVMRQEDVVECLCFHAAILMDAITGNAKIGQTQFIGQRLFDFRENC